MFKKREELTKMLFNFETLFEGATSGGVASIRIIKKIDAQHNKNESKISVTYTLPETCNVGVSTYHTIDPDKERTEKFIITDDYNEVIDEFYRKINPNNELEEYFSDKIKKMKLEIGGK